MKQRYRAILGAVVGTLVQLSPPAAQAAGAQRVVTVGSFYVDLVRDPATGAERATSAGVVPAAESPEGLVMWHCGAEGLQVVVELDMDAEHGATRPLVWRFDRDRPDSLSLRKGTGTLWHVPDDRIVPFTVRAKTAGRLVLRAPGAGSSAGPEYTYSLRGAREALDGLSCARNPAAPVLPPQAPLPPHPDSTASSNAPLPASPAIEPDSADLVTSQPEP